MTAKESKAIGRTMQEDVLCCCCSELPALNLHRPLTCGLALVPGGWGIRARLPLPLATAAVFMHDEVKITREERGVFGIGLRLYLFLRRGRDK